MESASCVISLDYCLDLDKIFSLREIYEAIVKHYLFVEIERSDSSYEYNEIEHKHRYIFSVFNKKGPLIISERIKMKILKHFDLEQYIGFKLVTRSPLIYMIKLKEINLIYKSWGVLSNNIDNTSIKRLKRDIEILEINFHVLPRTNLAERIAREKKAHHDVFMNKFLIIKKEKLHTFMKALSDATLQ